MKTGFPLIAILLALSCWLRATPVTYEEVSLLVRMHESDAYIAQQVSQRRFLRLLTPQQEAILKTQGASDAIVQALRQPGWVLSETDAVAFEIRRAEQKKAVLEAIAADAERENAKRALAAQAIERETAAAREKVAAEAVASDEDSPAPFRRGSDIYTGYVPAPSFATFEYNNGLVQRFGNPWRDPNCRVPRQSGDCVIHPDGRSTQKPGNNFVNAGGGTQRGGNTSVRPGGATIQRSGNAPVPADRGAAPVIGNPSPRR